MLYSSAVSIRVTPASNATLMMRVTSRWSHRAPKKSVPNVLPPSPTTETSRLPIRRISTSRLLVSPAVAPGDGS